jgi:formylglycine-generating enzyme required for sulfatase activity
MREISKADIRIQPLTFGGRRSDSIARAVPQWSGREVRALREARRMSVREFAAHLGVSDRMVSKWEAGGLAIRPRPINQAALDTSLEQATGDVRARFDAISGRSSLLVRQRTELRPDTEQRPAPLTHLVRHPDDGKLMTLVEAGVFRCGVDDTACWLAGFYLDMYPTTCADYARFIAATGHPAPRYWQGETPPDDRLNHPVVEVSWHDASAYAVWAAKLLPTGMEWEKAARGPAGAAFPWGEHAGPACSNLLSSRIGGTTPVDRYDNGVSAYGVYDLCGNVAEWCADGGGDSRDVRGGGFSTPIHQARPSLSTPLPPTTRRPDVGFRCALPSESMLELLAI